MKAIYVYVDIEQDEDGFPPVSEEEIEAVQVSPGRVRITGIPVFVYAMARGDLVKVVHNIEDHRLWVTEVMQESGHWTARVVPLTRGPAAPPTLPGDVMRQFESLGCTVYESPFSIVAIDIPAETDPESIMAALEEGQEAGAWDFDIGVSPPNWPPI